MFALVRGVYIPVFWLLCGGIHFAGAGTTAHDLKNKNLDEFGYEIFEQNLTGLERGKRQISAATILNRFGKPIRKDSILRDYRDPNSKGPFQYEELIWYFDGLVIQMGTELSSDKSRASQQVWLQRVAISTSVYCLKHGLRIGQKADRFVEVLGEPTYRDKDSLAYDVDNAVEVEPSVFSVTPYQVMMWLDREDKVQKIEWTWWWH